jgi:hypothetical protein
MRFAVMPARAALLRAVRTSSSVSGEKIVASTWLAATWSPRLTEMSFTYPLTFA